MRDMGTHLCALPTGERCPKGLVCLGCNHAQPKKSAAPTFRRMLASRTRALTRAQEIGESAGRSLRGNWRSNGSAAPRGGPRNCLVMSPPPPSRQPPTDNSSAGRRAGRPVTTAVDLSGMACTQRALRPESRQVVQSSALHARQRAYGRSRTRKPITVGGMSPAGLDVGQHGQPIVLTT